MADAPLPEPPLLFVYGTLQRGGCYHHLLGTDGVHFLGRGHTTRPYPLILDQYPCLLDRPGVGHPVSGEVYRIQSPFTWATIDQLEDHPREYRRRPEPIVMNSSRQLCWVYFYQDPTLSGDPVARFDPTEIS
jgi:gamma-glutamylcyclotransferase (GGCT)/AIG2-like uncharacterized protein YtfP